MTDFKVSLFIIGIVIATGVFTILFDGMAALTVNYNAAIPAEHNETFQALKDINAIDTEIQDIKGGTFNEDENPISVKEDDYDISGKFFAGALKTIYKLPRTVKVFSTMTSSSIKSSSNILGSAADPLKYIIITVVILSLIFLVLSAKLKWPL